MDKRPLPSAGQTAATRLPLDLLLAGAPDGLLILDAEGTVCGANDAAARLFRRSLAALAGCAIRTLLPDWPADGEERDFRAHAKPRQLLRVRVADLGEAAPGFRAVHVEASGQPTGELRAMLLELRRERNRAQQYLDVAGVMFVALDARGRITLMNRRACEILHCDEGESTGGDWIDLYVPPEQRERVREVFALLMTGDVELVLHYDNEVVARNGERRRISWHNALLRDEAGRIVGTLSSGEDITERRAAEQAASRAREIAANLSRELESLGYSVSHDLRSPLRAIASFTELMIADAGHALGEEARVYLHRIGANVDRMCNVLEGLAGLLGATRRPLDRQPIDLGALAREIAARLDDTALGRRVEWVIAEDLMADGDREMLRVVMEHLMGNARKYSARVAAPRIEVGGVVDEHGPVFFVRDNGVGFDPRHTDRLFAPFQRLHAHEYPGSGIGLALARRIIEHHGGKLRAEGQPGEGATFSFSLSAPPDADWDATSR